MNDLAQLIRAEMASQDLDGVDVAAAVGISPSMLSDIINGKVAGVTLTPEAKTIATYALCGFANFSSIAINIGCIGGIAPERRGELAKLGLRAMAGGALASCMTATLAGLLS